MQQGPVVRRSTQRPKYLDLPYALPVSPPVPRPKAADGKVDAGMAPRTRYGDWEREGIAWDF